MNVPAEGTVTNLIYMQNCVDWVSVLRLSQKSGDLGAGGSVGEYNYYWYGRASVAS